GKRHARAVAVTRQPLMQSRTLTSCTHTAPRQLSGVKPASDPAVLRHNALQAQGWKKRERWQRVSKTSTEARMIAINTGGQFQTGFSTLKVEDTLPRRARHPVHGPGRADA